MLMTYNSREGNAQSYEITEERSSKTQTTLSSALTADIALLGLLAWHWN